MVTDDFDDECTGTRPVGVRPRVCDTEGATQPRRGEPPPTAGPRSGRPRRRFAAVAAAVVLAAPSTVALGGCKPEQPANMGALGTRIAAPIPQFSAAQETYAPGQSSGWHVHAVNHAVVILSGTLTIYDQSCHRLEFNAGDVYLGGTAAHLARNETEAPVDLTVLYAFTSPGGQSTRPVDPPSGCDVQ